MLEFANLHVPYGKHRALEGAGLRVAKGEIVVILGANGAGKSTLLKSICGVCEGRVTGAVRMEGRDILGHPPHEIVDEGLALVPEGRGIFPEMTVEENLRSENVGRDKFISRFDAAVNVRFRRKIYNAVRFFGQSR